MMNISMPETQVRSDPHAKGKVRGDSQSVGLEEAQDAFHKAQGPLPKTESDRFPRKNRKQPNGGFHSHA